MNSGADSILFSSADGQDVRDAISYILHVIAQPVADFSTDPHHQGFKFICFSETRFSIVIMI